MVISPEIMAYGTPISYLLIPLLVMQPYGYSRQALMMPTLREIKYYIKIKHGSPI
jgi:hypothetical protein